MAALRLCAPPCQFCSALGLSGGQHLHPCSRAGGSGPLREKLRCDPSHCACGPVWPPACFSHDLSHSAPRRTASQRLSGAAGREERPPGARPRRSWARQGGCHPRHAPPSEGVGRGQRRGKRGEGVRVRAQRDWRVGAGVGFPRSPGLGARGRGIEMLSLRPGGRRRRGSSLSSRFSISSGGTATAGAAQAHCAPRSLQFPSPACGPATVWAAAAGGALLP